MVYSIFDDGNLVVSFEDEETACGALERIAREDPRLRDRLVLIAFDEDGDVVSEWIPGEHVSHAA